MLKKYKLIYDRQSFSPGLLGIFTNPFYFARLALWNEIGKFSRSLNGRLLDVGCGTKPYRNLFNNSEYVGLDIDSPVSRLRGIADYLYDGVLFPFAADEFDSILCNQVFEHVFNPDFFLSEISRVLKPGGKIILSVPFVWDEHEQPYDYARYTIFALNSLLERNGFRLINHAKTCADSTIIFQLINAYLYKIFCNYPKAIQFFLKVTVIAFFNLLGVILSKILPKNPDLYLDNVILAEKIYE